MATACKSAGAGIWPKAFRCLFLADCQTRGKIILHEPNAPEKPVGQTARAQDRNAGVSWAIYTRIFAQFIRLVFSQKTAQPSKP